MAFEPVNRTLESSYGGNRPTRYRFGLWSRLPTLKPSQSVTSYHLHHCQIHISDLSFKQFFPSLYVMFMMEASLDCSFFYDDPSTWALFLFFSVMQLTHTVSGWVCHIDMITWFHLSFTSNMFWWQVPNSNNRTTQYFPLSLNTEICFAVMLWYVHQPSATHVY